MNAFSGCAQEKQIIAVRGVCLSIQVAILKILASHRSGKASVSSISRDIAILVSSGAEWSARIKRLASRAPGIDVFGSGYVRRGDDGWEITAEGREFLARLEAVTQDNLPQAIEPEPEDAAASETGGGGDLIVVGHRFRNRLHRPGVLQRKMRAVATGKVRGSENASN